MKNEYREVLTAKLEGFVYEVINDIQKRGENDVIGLENVERKYLKGYLDGMCCALNCSYGKEGDFWVVRDGRRHVVARVKECFEDD